MGRLGAHREAHRPRLRGEEAGAKVNPVCHSCERRVAVSRPPERLAVALVGPVVDLDRALLALCSRAFVVHLNMDGERCAGSGQPLYVARGFEPDRKRGRP